MQSHKGKLVNIGGLSQHKGVPIRTLRSLMAAGKIPYLKFGHRTIFFDPEKVDRALQRFEVQEVGARSRREAVK
jgi:hypothetical protein